MEYFITGATGFIGGVLTRQLIEEDHRVVALVRDTRRAPGLAALGARLVQGDLTDRESLRRGMEGVDGVFHVAGWYKIGTHDKSQGYPINVEGTRNVLELMRELGIPKGVYTSTLAVFSDTHGKVPDETYQYDGPHLSEYDRTKWLAHYQVADPLIQAGLPLVIVLPGLVYGPGDSSPLGDAVRQYLQGKLPLLPKGTAFCWGHVEDIAQAHRLAMEKGRAGESYIICGPVYSMIDAFQLAERATGIPTPRMRMGPGAMKTLARLMDVVGAVIPLPETFAGESLRVSAGVTYLGDNSKARRELGYQPRLLEEGLPETLDFFMNELGIEQKKN